ncbi:hypothetical protein [Streptomyces sp. NPDC093109]|uniref:hypothetical protein n=1 Tax=Streptomyces sp. NPDC093109 TaxID=3154977 RepID=UPI00344E3421
MTANRRVPGSHWARRPLRFATDAGTLRRLLAALSRRPPADAGSRPGPSIPSPIPIPSPSPPSATTDSNATVDAHPIDFATLSHTVTAALALRIDLPERAWVDITTFKLRGHLERLLSGHDESVTPESHALHRDAHRLLTLCRDWDGQDTAPPPLHAYELMRALAVTTRDIAALVQRGVLQRGAVLPAHPRTQEPPR